MRLGRSKISLQDFQAFAVKLSREDASQGASEGINLIGFTHAPGQVPFLKKVLASTAEPGLRSVTIGALGMVCEEEAGGTLSVMLSETAPENPESKWIRDALQRRTTLSERTCRLARGETRQANPSP